MTSVTIDRKDLTDLVRNILQKTGADPSEASTIAEVMVWSDVMGRPNQGVWRLPTLVQRLRQGHIKSPCRMHFQKAGPSLGLLDGGQGCGQLVGHRAMNEAIQLARQSGAGMVGVKESNYFAAAAYYVQMAAEAEMIGLAMSNSLPHVAAAGGIKAVLGTNPFGFGAPRKNGRSILLDMSTAASAGSTIMKMVESDAPQSLPEGIALNKEGKPTRDPRQIGCLLPLGGGKGFGLSLMVEILSGVLTGAGFSHGVKAFAKETGHNGHFFIALDVRKFMPLETYYERLEALVDILINSGAPGGQATVLLPGEHRWQSRDQNLREGIPLDEPTARSLKGLAETMGVPLPWGAPAL